MRLFLALLTVAAAVAVAPMAASGATFRSESYTDPDFCGTGASVDVLSREHARAPKRARWCGQGGAPGSDTFTYGDASVIVSFAGQFTDTIVATEAGGVEIHQLISKGIPVKIQLANGPVLSIDAGRIVLLITVQNGNEDVQIVSVNGPHPLGRERQPVLRNRSSGARHHVAAALGIT